MLGNDNYDEIHSSNHKRSISRSSPIAPICEHSENEKGNAFSFATLLYAAFIIVFVLVGEASYEETPENSRKFRSCTVMAFYMHAVGIGFILYSNLFVIHPGWFNRMLRLLSETDVWQNAEKYEIVAATHDARAVNSLFLRLGVMLFGAGGAVLFALLLFLLITNKIHDIHEESATVEASLGLIFTFLQMYFMNVNYKLMINSSKNVCRLGFMHLLAVNVWTWYRFVTAKFHESLIKHAEYMNRSESGESSLFPNSLPIWVQQMPGDDANATVRAGVEILGLLEYFGDFAIVLATCLIEYSVIGAAVMFIFWKQIDTPRKAPQKRQLRIDFSYTLPGIYAGAVLAIIGVSAAAVYAALDNNRNRTILFGAFDSLCFLLCVVAVVVAACSMRSMTSCSDHHGEDVDDILLYVAVVGELVWNSAELANFMTGEVEIAQGAIVLAFTILRLVHVLSQTWFILAASRFGIMNELASTQGYLKLASAPLIVFYRFHCSVCLVEIWQKSFARPKEHRMTPSASNYSEFTIISHH